MWHEERYNRIRHLLGTSGQVSVERIVEELKVSRETVRRDLLALESLGEIQRVHGGAVLVGEEPPIDVRAATRVREKQAIAREVVRLVGNGQTVFLDAGTTTSIIAEALAGLRGLLVITNSLAVARTLGAGRAGQHDNHVHLLGGSFNAELSSTHGAATVAEIQRYQANVAILSPVGIDATAGASSQLLEEAEVARAMAVNARHTIIAADHAKIGLRSRVAYCPCDAIGTLVTNGRARQAAAMHGVAQAVAEVVYA